MSDTTTTHPGGLAMAIGLSGVLVAALIATTGKLLGHDFAMIAFGVFAVAQVAAIIIGVITRASLLGRSAAIMSSILLAGSVLFLI